MQLIAYITSIYNYIHVHVYIFTVDNSEQLPSAPPIPSTISSEEQLNLPTGQNSEVQQSTSVAGLEPVEVAEEMPRMTKNANKRLQKQKTGQTKKQKGKQVQKKDLNTSDFDEDLYEVEELQAHKWDDGTLKFQIKWKHFDASHATWEPMENINYNLVEDYLSKTKL